MPLYKDFYLAHPHPHFQCDEYSWGNMEEAHPLLSARTAEEVDRYRVANGISVESLRGRAPPKPFQSFQETSFPQLVVDIAYELFTTDATPFPVQAQAFPCILSGMDMLAVAPTGGGKTLAYLLPAIVHIMAQPTLQEGEGPIALVLLPTRELVEQTVAVARCFCDRMEADEAVRVRGVFGGVDPSYQLPGSAAPDRNRWPELLVATPGVVLHFVERGLMDLKRISFVVVDEADFMLGPSFRLDCVRRILSLTHPERQALFITATWSSSRDPLLHEFSTGELVKLHITPEVPSIPQEVRLCIGVQAELEPRKEMLRTWLRDERKQGESVLVVCMHPATVREVSTDRGVVETVGAGQVGVFMDGTSLEERAQAGDYERFARGDLAMLVTTFARGARGLDYAPPPSKDSGVGLSLAVFVLDFPPSIMEYIHCIGRTWRPCQATGSGRVMTLLPELRFWMAQELLQLIERCRQEVPADLRRLVDANAAFLAQHRRAMAKLREGGRPWQRAEDSICEMGNFDDRTACWTLPPSLSSFQRRLLHALSDELNIPHVSTGRGHDRRLHLAVAREALPDRFFWEGERVLHKSSRRDLAPRRGRVSDPKVHPQYRTVVVLTEDGRKERINVDELELLVGSAGK